MRHWVLRSEDFWTIVGTFSKPAENLLLRVYGIRYQWLLTYDEWREVNCGLLGTLSIHGQAAAGCPSKREVPHLPQLRHREIRGEPGLKSLPCELTSVDQLGPLLQDWGIEDLFLVADPQALRANGGTGLVQRFANGRRFTLFSEFVENPRLDDICAGVEAMKKQPVGAIVAIGGGTAIDVAKLIRCFSANRTNPVELVKNQGLISSGNEYPLIAIPTTSGTGSEATHFAVVYIDGVKYSVAHQAIAPDVSIVDSSLTQSMPASVTAVTGLDALCQAMESIWSINSTEESTNYAIQSLELSHANLYSAVHSPTPEVRAAMSRAANLSGKAINISKTTAPHALSYSITIHHGIPHGHAAALTLAAFLAYNHQVNADDLNDPRGVAHVQNACQRIIDTMGCGSVQEAQTALTNLMESIGCHSRLSRLDITSESQIHRIATSVNVARLANNPRQIGDGDIQRLLESIR